MFTYDFFVLLVYILTVLCASYMGYRNITTTEQRRTYRTKLQREFESRKEQMVEKAEASKLAELLERAGNPLRINAFRFQLIRYSFVLVLSIYYVIYPILSSDNFSWVAVAYVGGIYIFTGVQSKFSITKLVLEQIIQYKNRKKREELFTLFDQIKSKLNTLKSNQEDNIHNLLKGMLDNFDYIDLGIIKFMRNWKISPELARDSFAREIGGEHAEVLANILYKMDESSKESAIELIRNASETFSITYIESEERHENKKLVGFDLFIFCGAMVSLVWALVMIVSMYGSVFDTI